MKLSLQNLLNFITRKKDKVVDHSEEDISCLVKGLAVSINNGEWSLVESDGDADRIKCDESIIYFNRSQGKVHIYTWSFDHRQFNRSEINLLWDSISGKFPENGISKTDRMREKEKNRILELTKRFESLGCPDKKD